MADEDAIANNKTFVLADNFGSSLDPIRNDLKNYWITQTGEDLLWIPYKYGNNDGSTSSPLKDGDKFKIYNSEVQYEYGSLSPGFIRRLDPRSNLLKTTYKEKITITPRTSKKLGDSAAPEDEEVSLDEEFDNFIENVLIPSEGSSFSDHCFDIVAPIEYASNVDNRSILEGTVDYHYNYGLENYEKIINPPDTTENQIDNFYNFFQVVMEERDIKQYFKRPSVESLLIKSISEPDKVRTSDYKDFFITQEGYKASTSLFQYEDSFPFYNKISFSNPPGTSDADKLRGVIFDNDFTTCFCDAFNVAIEKSEEEFNISKTISDVGFVNSSIVTSYEDASQQEFKETYTISDENIKWIDIDLFLEILTRAPELDINEANQFLLINEAGKNARGYLDMQGSRSKELKYRIGKISSKSSTIKGQYISGLNNIREEIQSILDVETRNYRDILFGKKPYLSKVLFYRIAKFEYGSTTPIQNFWIPSESIYLGLDYVDLQVKYGKKYEYKIYAYKMTIGSEYQYQLQKPIDIDLTPAIDDYIKYITPHIEPLRAIQRLFNKFTYINKSSGESYENTHPTLPQLTLGGTEIHSGRLPAAWITQILQLVASKIDTDPGLFYLMDNSELSKHILPIMAFINNMVFSGKGVYDGEQFKRNALTSFQVEAFEKISNDWACMFLDKQRELAQQIEVIKFFESLKNKMGFAVLGKSHSQVYYTTYTAPDSDFERDLINLLGGNTDIAAKIGGKFGQYGFNADTVYLYQHEVTQARFRNALENYNKSVTIGDFQMNIWNLDNVYTPSPGYYGPKEFSGSKKFKSDKLSRDELEYLYNQMLVDQTLDGTLKTALNEFLECFDGFLGALTEISEGISKDYKATREQDVFVTTKPSPKFVEIPYYESRGTILDNPPLSPNVNFITYRGKDDKLSLFLNSSAGNLEEDPVIFSEKQEEYYKLFREARKMNDFQKILFKSDEFENIAATFEIRRLSSPPNSYEDFKDANTSVITTPYGIGQLASSAAFLDNIEPNRKYYYMFRSFDRRGVVSNPTAIHQVELVENSGAIYPLIEVYEFPKDPKQVLKSFKRLFNILPRLTQILPGGDITTFTTAGDIKLGIEEEALFGKTFKIRLTSKKTGKAVDLNVIFNSTVEPR